MDKLKIDTQDLRDTANELTLIKNEFDDADSNSDTLADAVGHGGLAGKIKDFAHNWDVHRKDMMKDLDALIDSLKDGADALEKTDNKLASSLNNNSGGN